MRGNAESTLHIVSRMPKTTQWPMQTKLCWLYWIVCCQPRENRETLAWAFLRFILRNLHKILLSFKRILTERVNAQTCINCGHTILCFCNLLSYYVSHSYQKQTINRARFYCKPAGQTIWFTQKTKIYSEPVQPVQTGRFFIFLTVTSVLYSKVQDRPFYFSLQIPSLRSNSF